MAAHVLLIETNEGDTVAVRFPSVEDARAWEEENEDRLGTIRGAVRLVSRAEAIKECR